jgi:hypothetical protein
MRMRKKAIEILRQWGWHTLHNIEYSAKLRGDTFSNCNCWMCRNPRRVFKEKTMQEKKQ